MIRNKFSLQDSLAHGHADLAHDDALSYQSWFTKGCAVQKISFGQNLDTQTFKYNPPPPPTHTHTLLEGIANKQELKMTIIQSVPSYLWI